MVGLREFAKEDIFFYHYDMDGNEYILNFGDYYYYY
jgi:hypothetical protein